MKKSVLFVSILVVLVSFCTNKNVSTQNPTDAKSLPFINQLFIVEETEDSNPCTMMQDDSCLFGAIYLTKRGNIIYNLTNEQRDTVSYFWGKYQLSDSTITYQLTDEYYYHGKWDARWDVADPDYPKGRTRKVKSSEITLFKTKCDTFSFSHQYNKAERNLAAKRHNSKSPYGFFYFPYYETKEMKFYTWIFKQIPVLAAL